MFCWANSALVDYGNLAEATGRSRCVRWWNTYIKSNPNQFHEQMGQPVNVPPPPTDRVFLVLRPFDRVTGGHNDGRCDATEAQRNEGVGNQGELLTY